MGNKVSNFFKQDWNSIRDFVGGAGDVLKDTATGIFGGGWHYGDVKRDFTNYGYDVANAFTGGNKRESAPVDPARASAKQAQTLAQFYNPNTASNQALWKGSGQISFSGQGPLAGVTPPSHLNTISDPTTKMMVASTRGTMRSTLNAYQTGTDALASQQLATATGPPTASQTTNSAGGTGVATSMDTS